jgi:hypothetical protein
MVLVQVLITAANNGTYFTVPVIGKASVRVVGIQYIDKTSTAYSRVLRLRSDNLLFNYSPQVYLTFISQASASAGANISFDVSNKDYHMKDSTFNGNLFLTLEQLYSSGGDALPAIFYCLVNLDVEQIDREYQ